MKFKFIDLNVWLGGQIFEPMLNFLKKENADILTLQEVYDENSEILPANFRCLSIIKKELNYPYSSFAPSTLWNNGTFKADIGNAILSRFPIETDNYVFYDRPYGQYTEGVIEDYPNISRTLQYALLNLGKVNLNLRQKLLVSQFLNQQIQQKADSRIEDYIHQMKAGGRRAEE